MSDLKQVKVDNWGIYFLQRLKHFFNRTDYCDLTLQFQDNAQLKVHRLVLSACTEYFELLERTCEMYEDCLVMPDDLQADVVVPIVNFMYTGQLEFRPDLLERLHQTSQIMNMPVLTKLLDAQRQILPNVNPKPAHRYTKKIRSIDAIQPPKPVPSVSAPSAYSNKRSYSKAFENIREKNTYQPSAKAERSFSTKQDHFTPTIPKPKHFYERRASAAKKPEPRPTRYDLPEELDRDGIFDDSFTNISYTSQPLVVHPEATKHYSKKPVLFNEITESSGYRKPVEDIVECRKILNKNEMYEDDDDDMDDTNEMTGSFLSTASPYRIKGKDYLFDQVVKETHTKKNKPKVVIEKDSKQGNIDHAKIISEVLKKYPHLAKGNKNIKLKILNSPTYPSPSQAKNKKTVTIPSPIPKQQIKTIKIENPDYTYESDVLNTKEAVKLISLGADNVKGPWICLICGTPGRALNFTSYYKFRRHLVEVHNEKPITNMCEYCGLVSNKRNHMLHHMYTKHDIEPPPAYHFPKCGECNYVALAESFLIKHKCAQHHTSKNFYCNICSTEFNDSQELLSHIQNTGHKYCADRRTNFQCIYCHKTFSREKCLYAHLKLHHKRNAINDGVIEDSDEEKGIMNEMVRQTIKPQASKNEVIKVKYEPQTDTSAMDSEDESETQYQIQQRPDGNIQVVSKVMRSAPQTQKILNPGFNNKLKSLQEVSRVHHEVTEPRADLSRTTCNEEIVVIDDQEYIVRGDKLIPKKSLTVIQTIHSSNDEYILSDRIYEEENQTNSTEYSEVNSNITNEGNQPIQYVVSSDEQYSVASEHPIIFEEGNTNKTLTVLTNPHSSVINTDTADINNTQPGEMMILQQNYPLNVSETLSADNPNIVVVYSHAVGDTNKPYQIISTQDLGAQFVQSSASLTATYETVTTTQITTTQANEVWTNNNEQVIENSIEMLSEQSLQDNTNPQLTLEENITEVNRIQEEGSQLNTVDKPQHYDPTCHDISQPTEQQEAQTQFEVVIEDGTQENIRVPIEMESHPLPDTENIENVHEVEAPIENDSTEQVVSGCQEQALSVYPETSTEGGSEQIVEDSNLLIDVEVNATIKNSEQLIECVEPTDDIPEKAVEEICNEDVEMTENNLNDTENNLANNSNDIENSLENHSNDIENNIEDNIIIKDQIQNLTSEWSEDEEDGTTQKNQTTVSDLCPTSAPSPDVEESVESIQHEISKQVEQGNDVQENTEDVTEDNEPSDQVNQAETDNEENGCKGVPQEKISSLLNDWEDNESQEDAKENNENNGEQEDPTATEKDDSHKSANEKKANNVKNLVSDWDEDEEEEEEVKE